MDTLVFWVGFNLVVLLLLAIDLFAFHRTPHVISIREAAWWSAFWIALSLGFNLAIWHWFGHRLALEFFTGWVIEKSLSVDNLFVFALLFHYFAVEPRFQHRVLFWGILGALVMRGLLIGAGVALILRFEWILYVFGAFLVYAGVRMLVQKSETVHPERNPVLRWARKFLPVSESYHGQKFFIRQEGIWRATPLLLVLIVMETTDLTFALDSIPAVFSVTRDPFIVYSSNVCAILGLRALYFLLAGALPYFRYLGTGLSIVLLFIGAKMLGEHWIAIPTHASLLVVAAILFVAIGASLIATRSERRARAKKEKPAPHETRPSSEEF